jgi:hypothetical protein
LVHSPGAWAEKLFFDAVKSNKKWTTDLNVESTCPHWYHNNVLQLNQRHYAIRMFVIPLERSPTKIQIVGLGNTICKNINATHANTTTTTLDETHYFWLPDGAVWSDVIGYDAALTALLRKAGPSCDNYYSNYEATIHTFFHPATSSLDLARTLRAPNDQIHPSERQHLEQRSEKQPD